MTKFRKYEKPKCYTSINEMFRDALERSGDVGVARETIKHWIESTANAAYKVQKDMMLEEWTDRGD